MKRIVSLVLTVFMLFSMLPTAFAEPNIIPNPLNMELGMKVEAKNDGEPDGAYALSLPLIIQSGERVGVDYRATLDMSGIRDLFSEDFLVNVIGGNQALTDKFKNGDVTTTITVVINYPTTAIIEENLLTAGVLNAGDIFEEVDRKVLGNTVEITYVNEDDLKVEDLNADPNGPLKDIVFTLEDAVSYNNNGTHEISVTLSGSTELDFGTKQQTVNYNGAASHIVTATVEAANHVLEVVPVVPATCVKVGSTEGVICRTHGSYECGAKGIVRPVEIPKIPHQLTFIEEEPATCSKTGVKAHHTCILCKNDFIDGVMVNAAALVLAKAPHTPSVIPGKAPTCTVSGLTEGSKCSVCGHIIVAQQEIPTIPHDIQILPAVAPTCTETGLTEGKVCNVSGTVTEPQKVLPALGHDYGEWTVVIEPTENSEGKKQQVCSRCGDVKELAIPKLVHRCRVEESLAEITTQPTCTEKGKKQNYCACGKKVGGEVEVPALGHHMSFIERVLATCTTEGIAAHYECSTCNLFFRDAEGKIKMNSIKEHKNKDNHGGNLVEMSPVEATCVHEGLTVGEKCRACDKVTVKQKKVKKADHVLEVIAKVEPGCDTIGIAEHTHCKVCNKDFDMAGKKEAKHLEIPALGHSYGPTVVTVEPTETTLGEGVKTCTRDASHTKTVEIEMLRHQHNEISDEIIVYETCTETGLKRKIYSCCGEIVRGQESIVIPAHPHTKIFVPAVDSTCYADGVGAYYMCSECNQMFSERDNTVIITAPTVLAKKVHKFKQQGPNKKKCEHCGEVVNVVAEEGTNADVKGHGGIKDDTDKVREEVIQNIAIESDIKISKREEISPELESILPGTQKDEKVVIEVVIEKVTTHTDEHGTEIEKDIELVPEVEELIEIDIVIPVELHNMRQYNVVRLHAGTPEEIRTTPNRDGEYIVIDRANHIIKLFVRKFSEYAVVAFEEEAVIEGGSTSTGGGDEMYTVKFNANGGTVVKDVRVVSGTKINAPVTTREGYEFTGWYTDMDFTQLFDFNTAIKHNMTLYAGWKATGASGDGWFVDVNRDDWFYDVVKYAYNNGWMKGISDTHFDPNGSITRAMFVTILYRIENEPDFVPSPFVDLEVDSWYEDAVAWAYEHGVTIGVSDTEFAPDRIIIREQIVAMIYRYAKFKGYDITAYNEAAYGTYADAKDTTEYAVPAFTWAVSEGIINGKSATTLKPHDNATRAEAAALMMRLFEKFEK